MSFIDEAKVFVKGGDGGQGCVSFYKDNYTRYAKPDGGDGGKGGDVQFVADRSIQTLLDFKYKQHYKGERGGHASSKQKQGKDGKDCILRVPLGTILRDYNTGFLIRDLVSDGQSVVVAKGGLGGRGNASRREPKPPNEGEERYVSLELKVIADVGIVGFPNAGKSTLISQISKVKSKIARYPFTTKSPVLGVVQDDEASFTIADLPGIIEGAHQGKGLGDRFLRHAERTKILLHMIDMAATEGRDPLEDYEKLTNELESYGEVLESKKRILIANKMDLDGAAEHLKRFERKYKRQQILAISALEQKGLAEVIKTIKDNLCPDNSPDQ